MAVISRGRPKIKSFAVLLSAALGLLMTNAASSPQVPEGGITIKEMMEKARPNTPESIYFVEQLARSNAVESIPMLEQKFKETQDEFDKDHIASALIRLEDRDNTYWDFLLNSATDVLDSDAPFPFVFDEHGRKLPIRHQVSLTGRSAEASPSTLPPSSSSLRCLQRSPFWAEPEVPRQYLH